MKTKAEPKAGERRKKSSKPETHRSGTPQIGPKESQNSLHTVELKRYRAPGFGGTCPQLRFGFTLPPLHRNTPRHQNKRVGPKNFRKNFEMMLHFSHYFFIGADTR
jgi:hypothetical protein